MEVRVVRFTPLPLYTQGKISRYGMVLHRDNFTLITFSGLTCSWLLTDASLLIRYYGVVVSTLDAFLGGPGLES
jgi:hypothetical protein